MGAGLTSEQNAVGLGSRTPLDTAHPINWYPRPIPDLDIPDLSPAERFHFYKALADNGDGFAAHQLANMVLGCGDSFRSEEELEVAVKSMRETFIFVEPWSGRETRANSEREAELFIELATRRFQVCGEVDGDPRDNYLHWLEVGAADRYTVAMLDYANTMDDRVAATELIREAWLAGDPNALAVLARKLNELYQDGTDPTANVPSAAAMYAFVELRIRRFPPSEDSVVGRITLDYLHQLREIEGLLQPHERDAAMAEARQMIESNGNCCYSH